MVEKFPAFVFGVALERFPFLCCNLKIMRGGILLGKMPLGLKPSVKSRSETAVTPQLNPRAESAPIGARHSTARESKASQRFPGARLRLYKLHCCRIHAVSQPRRLRPVVEYMTQVPLAEGLLFHAQWRIIFAARRFRPQATARSMMPCISSQLNPNRTPPPADWPPSARQSPDLQTKP